MLKILSIALALSLCLANYTQAANQPPSTPYQNEPMQSIDKLKQPNMKPSNHNQKMTPPSDDATPPAAKPSKGKRPDKKPDQQPGGDKIPPEMK